jgi:TRAP-type C4-dicarboxylate transport system substrate-binding protein
MNRRKFEALPKPIQDIIHKYSGAWSAERFIEVYDRSDVQILEQLKADPKRKVVFPSLSDLEIAHGAFAAVIAEWAAKSPHNGDLVKLVEAERAKLGASR